MLSEGQVRPGRIPSSGTHSPLSFHDTNSATMWFKVKWSSVDMSSTEVAPALSREPQERYSKLSAGCSLHHSHSQTNIIDLPDDVLLMIFLILPPKDLIRWPPNYFSAHANIFSIELFQFGEQLQPNASCYCSLQCVQAAAGQDF